MKERLAVSLTALVPLVIVIVLAVLRGGAGRELRRAQRLATGEECCEGHDCHGEPEQRGEGDLGVAGSVPHGNPTRVDGGLSHG